MTKLTNLKMSEDTRNQVPLQVENDEEIIASNSSGLQSTSSSSPPSSLPRVTSRKRKDQPAVRVRPVSQRKKIKKTLGPDFLVYEVAELNGNRDLNGLVDEESSSTIYSEKETGNLEENFGKENSKEENGKEEGEDMKQDFLKEEPVNMNTSAKDSDELQSNSSGKSQEKKQNDTQQKAKSHSSLPRNPKSWTYEQVETFFKDSGFPQESKVFKEQEIDGSSLMLLRRNDVLTGLSLKLGPALKIYSHISRLQGRDHYNINY